MNILLLVALLFGWAETPHPERASYKVRISVEDGWHIGSGTAIGPKVILTNSHVVGHRKDLLGYVGNQIEDRWIPVKCVGVNEDLDIAMLYIMDDTEVDWVPLGEKAPREIRIFGFNGDSTQLVKGTGKVYAWADTRFGTRNGVLIANAQVVPGNSGSGVYDAENKFSGIVWGADPDVYFTPIELIREKFVAWEVQCGPGGCSPGRSSSGGGRFNNPLRPAPIPDADDEPQVAAPEPKPPKQEPRPPVVDFKPITDRLDKLEKSIAEVAGCKCEASPGCTCDLESLKVDILTSMPKPEPIPQPEPQPEPTKEKQLIYVTADIPEVKELNQKVELAKDKGYNIVVVTLKPSETSVSDIPRGFVMPERRLLLGVDNIEMYLASLVK